MISWQEQCPWKIDTSPNALRGLTTLPRIFTRRLLIRDFCLRQLFGKCPQSLWCFQSPDFIPSEGKEWYRFQLSPSQLSVEQQSPGAPRARLPRGAPSPSPLRGHRGVPLPPFAHISLPGEILSPDPQGSVQSRPGCLPPTLSSL